MILPFHRMIRTTVLLVVVVLMGTSNLPLAASQEQNTTNACEEETAALNTNADISAAAGTLLTSTKDTILADFSDFCKLVSRSCTVDMSVYSSEFKSACEANQGVFVEQTYTLACETDTVSPLEIPGRIHLEQIPSCLGSSCDPANLPTTLVQYQTDLVESINTEVDAALGDSVTCEVASQNSSSPVGRYRTTTAGGAVVAALLLVASFLMP